MKKHWPDVIKRTLIVAIWAAFLAYMVYLFTHQQVIVQWEYIEFNAIMYGLLMAVILYKIVFFGIVPKAFFGMKMTKATILVTGVVLIMIGDHMLLNDPDLHVYVGDIVKILWVVITILAPTNAFITKKVKKAKEESTMEIIEA